jgi:SNF2 family DNA or RNA helicase
MIDKRNPYKNLDELHEKMFSCAFQVEVEQNLPETQDIIIEYDMPPASQQHYRDMVKHGVAELAEGVAVAGNVLSVLTKLQQITSGYLPVEDDEGEKKVVLIDTARREALSDLLEGLPPDEPVVVFAKYRKDITNIRNAVKAMGRKSSEVSGKRDTLSNWEAGKTTVLVVQISAGAEGIDLTRARYCIYYSHTQSLGQYLQSRKRVHRPGQTRPVVYYRIVAKMKKGKSVDEKIVAALDANQSLVDAIMAGEDLD